MSTSNFQDSPPVPPSIRNANQYEYNQLPLQVLEGTLPMDVQGHVFMVTSIGTVNSGGLPYPDGDSLLCGDGMIYRLDFDTENQVKLTTRIAKPPDYYADKATDSVSQYQKYRFRNHGLTRFSLPLGIRNQLNTAFLPMKFSEDAPARLLVTYDAGRPYEIDTESLDVVTPVGSNQEWQSEVQGYNAPFQPFLSTAHPGFDPYTKEMFTVNYGRSLFNFLDSIAVIHLIDQWLHNICNFWRPKLLKNSLNAVSQSLLSIFGYLYGNYFKWFNKSPIKIKDFVSVMCWDGATSLKQWQLVLPDSSPVKIEQTIHQIGVTKDYIVIMDTSFTMGVEQVLNNPLPHYKNLENQLRNILEEPPLPYSAVYIVPRNQLQPNTKTVTVKKVILPLEAAHFLVDYENPEGNIILNAAHISGMDVSEWVRQYDVSAYPQYKPEDLCGMVPGQVDLGRMGRYVIHGESGNILQSHIISDAKYTWGTDLYTYPDQDSQGQPLKHLDDIYWCSFGLWKDLMTKFVVTQYQNYKNRLIPLEKVLDMASSGVPAYLFRLHASSTKSPAIVDSYELPPGYVVLSPQFMPYRGAKKPTDGYIVCTVWHGQENEYWIFDANHLSKGPVCRLSSPPSQQPLHFAMTLHTAWLPKISKRQANYYLDVRQDYQELVAKAAKKHPKIEQLFEDYVYPNFEQASKP
ncbi:carotenoid oxygenase family protein [Nostoc spongiaeforme FACHB-130]|uniref:Carotenoid oxygenase family protein n=1 Tax=Nostoc spongiaeforme FACHB-130 TaxID=1357510 RepID=A0ABR8FZP6_9NOSO|nr:carotenoid oxygenase family protein [Nostoc spongiaeforme]MBD2596263.1 carotenoid oxygenase family protein [Nostoc spongiaeforme FACHB-130]